MSNADNELCQIMMPYFMGISKIVEEFGGSLNGTSVMLPKDAWKWMPKLIDRFNPEVKQQYGRKVIEIPGISFIWQDELLRGSPDDDPNA